MLDLAFFGAFERQQKIASCSTERTRERSSGQSRHWTLNLKVECRMPRTEGCCLVFWNTLQTILYTKARALFYSN